MKSVLSPEGTLSSFSMRPPLSSFRKQLTACLGLTWVRCCLLALLGFLVRLPAMQGSLIWDDDYLAHENPFIKSPLLILETFRHYLFPEAFSTHYRPVQTVSYLFDYAFWNSNTYGFHLSNICWHVGSGLLLYSLARRLLRSLGKTNATEVSQTPGINRIADLPAFFLALLWVVHPVHSAAVDYISGRADSLAFFFACGSWLLFLRAGAIRNLFGKFSLGTLAAVSLLLALCSRESALLWVLIFLFHLFAFEKNKTLRARFLILALVLCLVGIYAGLRHLPRDVRPTPTASTTTAPVRAVLMLRALGDYGRLMIFPGNLHMERTVESPDAASFNVVGWRRSIAAEYLSIAGLLVAVALGLGASRKGPGQAVRILGAAWFIIAFLPISNLIELNATVAEHWLYLPSVGFLIFLTGICLDFPRRTQPYLAAAASCCVLALGVRSFIRSSDWESPETFYRHTIGAGGAKVRVALNLAAIYTNRGEYPKAESLLRKVLEMSPDYPIARNSLAHVLFKEGRKAEADALFVASSKAAQEARKDYPKTWVAALNVAHMRANEHQPEAALAVLAQATHDYPDTWELICFEAELLREDHGAEAAIVPVKAFAEKNWWHYGAAIALGKLYFEKGDLVKAEAALRQASRLDVHDVCALNLMTAMSLNQNHIRDAYDMQRRALARQPDEPRQYLLLSDILTRMGRTEEARATLAQVTRLEASAKAESVID
ncbi:MAG: tetratricopeptide repeat protein [Chthoniobacterales bacterium]